MVNKTVFDSTGIITFDAPKGNLLSIEDIDALLDYINIVETDSSIKGVVITGKGRSFSAGLDISYIIDGYTEEKSNHFFEKFDLLLLRLFTFPKPLVAAVNGHSIGGGLLLQSCADWVCIAENSSIKVGLPELKLGLSIDSLMKSLLNYSLNNSKLISKILHAESLFGYQQSKEFGLADVILPEDQLMESSIQYVQTLQAYDTNSFRTSKQIVKSDTKTAMELHLRNKCYTSLTMLLTAKYRQQ